MLYVFSQRGFRLFFSLRMDGRDETNRSQKYHSVPCKLSNIVSSSPSPETLDKKTKDENKDNFAMNQSFQNEIKNAISSYYSTLMT